MPLELQAKLLRTLASTATTIRKTAEVLGISLKTLYTRLEGYGAR